MNQAKLKISESEVYTAIQQRILQQDLKIADQKPEALEKLLEDLKTAIGKLLPFADQAPVEPERVIPYEIKDYLELVDWSGRQSSKASAAVSRKICRRFWSG